MNQGIPDPRLAGCFQFVSCAYDPAQGEARLVYRFDEGPELVERIGFPHVPWPPEASRQAAFQESLRILHLVAGVSYYKAGLSRKMGFEQQAPDRALAEFLTGLYVQGLGEFAYINQVDVRDKIHFREDGPGPSPQSLVLRERALVAMGGGKDSLVGLHLLQEAGVELLPVCIGKSPLIADTVRAAKLPLIRIERSLAPELAVYNRAGAWNGHVPVTAINSAILLCAAILYGFRHIVFSNERSADEATLTMPDGTAVNHQYSKSSGFEKDFRDVISSRVSPDIEYFSVLRPFSELDIVRRFSLMTDFHTVYSSCNRNFHIDGARIEGRWCRDCPKCRFAALSLALFLPPAQVKAILGGDLLTCADQVDGFRALCGIGRDKPFECVGEAGESRAALAALARDDQWRRHLVVRTIVPELVAVTVPGLDELLRPASRHFIPQPILAQLQEHGCGNSGAASPWLGEGKTMQPHLSGTTQGADGEESGT
jgi:hypothetical protein